MIDTRLYEKLGVNSIGLFISKVEVNSFGRSLGVELLNTPWGEQTKFQMSLVDCNEIVWSIFIYSFDPLGSESPYGADVIGIDLGEEEYDKPLIITTDKFEIVVRYKTISIVQIESLSSK